MSEELRHKTNAVHDATTTVTSGDNIAFTRRAFNDASTVAY